MKSHAFIGFVFYAALIGNRYSIVRFGKEDRIPPPISSFSLPFSIKSTAAQTTQGMHFVLGGGGWRLEEHRRSSATDLMCFDTAHSIVFARCFPSLALSHYLYTQALELPPAGRWLLLLLHSLRSEREPLSHPIVAIAPLDGITTWGHDLSTLKRYLRVYPFPLGFTPSFHSWIHSWHDITSVYSTFFDSGIRSIVNSFTPHCLYCGHFQRFVTFNFYQHLWRLKTNPKLTGGTIVLIFVICIPVNWFGCAVQH